MALRSLDNALPTSLERPKKVARVAAPAAKPPHDCTLNDENAAPPPKTADQSAEYIASEDLQALPDPETKIKTLLDELESKDWTKVCEALNDVRRLALYHSPILLPIFLSCGCQLDDQLHIFTLAQSSDPVWENVLLVMVKAMKNPRSALCKTAIMASTDIFHSLGHLLLSTSDQSCAFDHLLLQLLLKASQDKRFVCEEAEKALEKMAGFMSPLPLLKKLQSYVNHSNLRVRAKAAVAISKCISNTGIDIMKEFGLVTLLQIAAELLNDRLPEAREAARSIINSIHCGFSKTTDNEDEGLEAESWQSFCSSNLPPISAQSIAKILSQ